MIKKLSIAFLVLTFLGFLDAAYLTIIHYKNTIPPCTIAHGCETVLTSKYATLGPVPIALIGVGFYLAILILTGMLLQGKNSLKIFNYQFSIINLLILLTGSGVIVAGSLVYLQAFVLHAFCQYCLASEAIDILLFLTALQLRKSN